MITSAHSTCVPDKLERAQGGVDAPENAGNNLMHATASIWVFGYGLIALGLMVLAYWGIQQTLQLIYTQE